MALTTRSKEGFDQMASRTVTAATAAALALTGCVSPYAENVKQSQAACLAGDHFQCDYASRLMQLDAAWHAEQQRNAENALAVLGAAALVSGAIISASHPPPPPPPPPVFFPAPPIPLR
jgi:hypothetical protein